MGSAPGRSVRRRVLGDEHVARAEAAATSFDADFQRFITETAWGAVWARPGLDLRTRSLITVALLAALGRHKELELHLRATRNTGASPDEVAEALMHVAAYAGIPAANAAFARAKEILFGEEDGLTEEG
jgi:4-carboxymuconolactone decarboxylase